MLIFNSFTTKLKKKINDDSRPKSSDKPSSSLGICVPSPGLLSFQVDKIYHGVGAGKENARSIDCN